MWTVHFNEMEAVNHTLALGQPSSEDLYFILFYNRGCSSSLGQDNPYGTMKAQLLPNCNASINEEEQYSFDSLEIHPRLNFNKGLLNSQRSEGYKVNL